MRNYVELLRDRAVHRPNQPAFLFMVDGEIEEARITYNELDCKARAIGALLQSLNARSERAVLLYPFGLDYITAFFGCLYAGTVAVPAYPPRLARLRRNLQRIQSIVSDSHPSIALTTSPILSMCKNVVAQIPELQGLRWVVTDNIEIELAEQWRAMPINSDSLAFLQYTSGSTSAPKGVMVSHGNLLHNEELIKNCFRQTEESKIVGWLPLYHDMGLIGNVLQPLYLGATSILMSPVSFLQNPVRWLQAISRYRATTSGGPNFAYDLCVRKIPPEQRQGLDLSSWTTAFNGAEPIRHETLERFAEAFEPFGFQREAFSPCYGLAEATLMVSGGSGRDPRARESVQKSALEQNKVVFAGNQEADPRILVSSGRLLPGQRVEIVDPKSFTLSPPNSVGEIWISGPSVAQGYWGQDQNTVQTFQAYLADTGAGPFLRTGDLGFLRDGNLFVTGRLKDVIIIRGRNLYPQDIESTVENSHPALRRGGCAAFPFEIDGEERLVVVQELEYRQRQDTDKVIETIRQAVADEYDVRVDAIALIRPGTISKTSSGKIQRFDCRNKYHSGELDLIAEWRLIGRGPTNNDSLIDLIDPVKESDSIENWLRAQLAARTGLNPAEIDVNLPIIRYGLDSMVTIELAHEIEDKLGVVISLPTFYEASVAELADKILTRATNAPPDAELGFVSAESGAGVHPLSYGQRSLWFLHQLAPESPAYNLANAVRIRSELSVPAMRHAFQSLVDRHACLRTTFGVLPDGSPAQNIHNEVDVCFQEVDALAYNENKLNRHLTFEAYRPFSLEHGPLMRVTVFKRSPQEWALLLVIHHIIADLWSLTVLINELGILYERECTNTQTSLPSLKLQYSDYAHWQAGLLAGPREEELYIYWKNQLSGKLPFLNLPTDHPRPSIQRHRGRSLSFRVSKETGERLKALCLNYSVTPFMGLLAAFQAILYRYTGQEDFLIGSPTSGRNRAGLRGIVGYFVNPVVLRASLSAAITFEQLLNLVQRTVLDAFEHQDYPFALLVERLQPDRDPSRSPLVQVMFNFQRAHLPDAQGLAAFALGDGGEQIRLGGLCFESMTLPHRAAQFDLTLSIANIDDGMKATVEYNSDLFDAITIERMTMHFRTLLEAMLAAPFTPLSVLPVLTAHERQQLIIEWNNTHLGYPGDKYLHQLFEEKADLTPDIISLVCHDAQLSYYELNRRANRVAHHLRQLGIGPDKRVGLCVWRSIEMVVGLLGILKAGGTYVPLDPSYPLERLFLMLEDAEINILLTQQRLLGQFQQRKINALCLDKDWEQIAQNSAENPISRVLPEHISYIIFTSGSTGAPKGVMIEHRNLTNISRVMDEAIEYESSDTWLAVTSVSFDISVLELLWAVARGFKVVVQDEQEIAAQMLRHGISHLQCTPSLARMMSLETESSGALKGLKTLVLGGEALPLAFAEELGRKVGGNIHNMYGPTETTIYSTGGVIDKPPVKISIGRPVANTETYVVDKQMQPVPINVPGELLIGGKGVVRGYQGSPGLTAEKFIPDPFGADCGGRLYRTGDLACYLPSSRLEFLGRIDHQVKIHGFRIELGEIETALLQYPGIRETVVIVEEESTGEKRLVAYIVTESEEIPGGDGLRDFLKRKLPSYMIPAFFIRLNAMPLTPSGKIHRGALPRIAPRRPELEVDFISPRNAVEELLAAIWTEILGLDQIGVEDNFFNLGGHSLLASQLVWRLREILKIDFPLRDFFQTPTIAGMAGKISEDPQRREQVEKIGELLIKVAQYSDDEVGAMLNQANPGHQTAMSQSEGQG